MSIFSLMKTDKMAMITKLERECRHCTKCPVYETGMGNCAFYRGNPDSPVFLLSEKSGPSERDKGYPFASKTDEESGRSYGGTEGQMLTCLQMAGIIETPGVKTWKNVFATNCCICALPGNRKPTAIEVKNCQWWTKTVGIVNPKLIIALGSLAVQQLLTPGMPKKNMTQVNGKKFVWNGITVVCAFNPAYLIRLKSDSKIAYEEAIEPWRNSIAVEIDRAMKGWSYEIQQGEEQ